MRGEVFKVFGGLCEVEGEVVKSGEQVGVKPDRWMVGLRCSGGSGGLEGRDNWGGFGVLTGVNAWSGLGFWSGLGG